MKPETFLISLALTLLLELPVALLWGLRGRELLAAVLCNTLTNPPAVFAYLLLAGRYPGVSPLLLQFPIEAAVVLTEWGCYRLCTGAERPLLLSFVANGISYGMGVLINLWL